MLKFEDKCIISLQLKWIFKIAVLLLSEIIRKIYTRLLQRTPFKHPKGKIIIALRNWTVHQYDPMGKDQI